MKCRVLVGAVPILSIIVLSGVFPGVLADDGTVEQTDVEAIQEQAMQAEQEEDGTPVKDPAANEPGEASYNVENCQALLRADDEGANAAPDVKRLDLDKCRQWVK